MRDLKLYIIWLLLLCLCISLTRAQVEYEDDGEPFQLEEDTDIDDETKRSFIEAPLKQPPANWVQMSSDDVRIDKSFKIPLLIFVRQESPGVVASKVEDVSDPMHVSYGQYLTNEEVNLLVSPSDHSLSRVNHFLSRHNITIDDMETTLFMHIIRVKEVEISKIEEMFQCEFNAFRNSMNPSWVVLRTLEYSVPYYLREVVDLVSPSMHFDIAMGPVRVSAMEARSVDEWHKLYTMDSPWERKQGQDPFSEHGDSHASASVNDPRRYPKQRVVVVGNSINNVDPTDIKLLEVFNNRGNRLIVSPFNRPLQADLETTVLIQYLVGFPRNITTITHLPEYIVATDSTGRRTSYIETGESIPSALFTLGRLKSYVNGGTEPSDDTNVLPNIIIMVALSDEVTLSDGYLRRVQLEIQKLSLAGVSVLSPVGMGAGSERRSDSSQHTCQVNRFFPATIPEVTAVGHVGFSLVHNPTDHDGRDGDGSLGGFRADNRTGVTVSRVYKTPKYQQRAIDVYRKRAKHDIPWKLVNLQWRAGPDVSFSGENCIAMFHKKVERVRYSPICSLAVLSTFAVKGNQEVVERWKKANGGSDSVGRPPTTLGSINKLVYTILTPMMDDEGVWEQENNILGIGAIIDVVDGKTHVCDEAYLHAEKGFDVVSGWGVLVYTRLLEMINKTLFV